MFVFFLCWLVLCFVFSCCLFGFVYVLISCVLLCVYVYVVVVCLFFFFFVLINWLLGFVLWLFMFILLLLLCFMCLCVFGLCCLFFVVVCLYLPYGHYMTLCRNHHRTRTGTIMMSKMLPEPNRETQTNKCFENHSLIRKITQCVGVHHPPITPIRMWEYASTKCMILTDSH